MTPVNPNAPSGPNVVLPPSSPPPSSPQGPPDTLENLTDPPPSNTNADPPLPPPTLTIKQFAEIIDSAIDQANQKTWEIQQDTAVQFNALYLSIVQEASNSIAKFGLSISLSTTLQVTYQEDNQNVNTLNTAIDTYNTGGLYGTDLSETQTMNAAIQTYDQAVQNNTVTPADIAAYQAAVSTYNSYVNTRNSSTEVTNVNGAITTFNTEANSTNNTISTINSASAGTTIPQVTDQDQYTNSLTPLPTLDPPQPPPFPAQVSLLPVPQQLPVATNTINPPSIGTGTFIQQLFTAFYAALFANLSLNQNFLDVFSTYNEFLQFIYNGTLPIIRAAYTTPKPRITLGGGSGGTGSPSAGMGAGVMLETMITTLSNPLMKGILSNSAYKAFTANIRNPFLPDVLGKLDFFNLQLLTKLGLYSGLAAIGHIGSNKLATLDFQSSTAGVTQGLAFANQIAAGISSGNIQKAIQGILTSAFPNVPANNLTDLTNQLTSASQLLFLGIAISQIAQAVGNPQLFGQVVASLGNANSASVLNSPANLTLQDVLSNQVSVSFLKQAIAQSSNLSEETVDTAVNNALTQNQITSADQLNASIKNALVQSKANESDAINAANQATTFAQAEAESSFQLEGAANTQNSNRDHLARELAKQNIDNNNATSAVNASFIANETLTNRQLRDRLTNQLVNQGVSRSTALLASTKAVVSNTPTPSFAIAPVSTATLRAQLGSSVVNAVSPEIGLDKAQDLANQVVTTVVGNQNVATGQHSLRTHLDNQLTALNNQQDETISNAADDILRAFNRPNVNLYAFNQQLQDPGKQLIHSISTGLMYARPSASVYQTPATSTPV